MTARRAVEQGLDQQRGVATTGQVEGEVELLPAGVEFVVREIVRQVLGDAQGGALALREEHLADAADLQVPELQPLLGQYVVYLRGPRIVRPQFHPRRQQRQR